MASHPLDNPVWGSLTGAHASLAVAAGRYLHYRDHVGLFAATADRALGFDDLSEAMADGAVLGIVTPAPIVPPRGLEVVEIATVPQMLAERLAPPADVAMRLLGDADVPAMLELAGLTHPGPFFERTIEMGGYLGVFDGPRLVAMAGERMRPPGYTEVSAVCTHPDYQGRGYAKALVTAVGRRILARGETPFLHVRAGNAVAISVYRALGFVERHEMTITVLRKT